MAAGSSALGATWLAMSLPALLSSCQNAWDGVDTTTGMAILTPDEARELEAVVAQLIPSTETPGAREAGVIHFLDSAFGTFLSSYLEPIRAGLPVLASRSADMHAEKPAFSALSDSEQQIVLESLEAETFFGLLQFATVLGMFSHPRYGGNRDKVGWDLLGFDDRHAWQPPFGHYDAEVINGE
jgi:gluconate 2-dehydrogenase gamma chain